MHCCFFSKNPFLKIWLQIVVKAINFDALHQLLYLYPYLGVTQDLFTVDFVTRKWNTIEKMPLSNTCLSERYTWLHVPRQHTSRFMCQIKEISQYYNLDEGKTNFHYLWITILNYG